MGTKNNPGPIDCYGDAAPDEPIFVLRANDETAALVVRIWAEIYMASKLQGGALDLKTARKYSEARDCATAMEHWRNQRASPFHEIIDCAANPPLQTSAK